VNKTLIPWVKSPDGSQGFTWNCIIGCQHASSGCANCWAERLAATRLDHQSAYHGLTSGGRWTGEQRFFPERLAEPLRRRKPAGIFVCDMSDLFGEGVTNEQIAAVYGVMAETPRHLFYVCTKRAKRRREWFKWANSATGGGVQLGPMAMDGTLSGCYRTQVPMFVKRGVWPLPNVIELTSVEDQKTADERIPDALETPAAVRGLSVEPLLEAVQLDTAVLGCKGHLAETFGNPLIHWIVLGGESGPRARPCRVEWIRSIVRQCAWAGTSCFVKQIGSTAIGDGDDVSDEVAREWDADGGNVWAKQRLPLRARAGADPAEWPADLRIRQFPQVKP
jgi:protein gp37